MPTYYAWISAHIFYSFGGIFVKMMPWSIYAYWYQYQETCVMS